MPHPLPLDPIRDSVCYDLSESDSETEETQGSTDRSRNLGRSGSSSSSVCVTVCVDRRACGETLTLDLPITPLTRRNHVASIAYEAVTPPHSDSRQLVIPAVRLQTRSRDAQPSSL